MDGRYLLGVTSDEETLAFLQRQTGLAPNPAELAQRARVARQRRASRGAMPAPEVTPAPEAWRDHLQRVAARPLFQRLYAGRPWQFAAVPLDALVCVQPFLNYTFAGSRAADDEPGMLRLCLPAEPERLEVWGGIAEAETPAASFYTWDPNVHVTAAKVETHSQLRVTFTISKTAVFLQVARIDGRLYLKNGTHRAVGLAAAGFRHLAAIVVDHPDHDELPRILPRRILAGPCPPLIGDFLDPDFYVTYPWVDRVKFIRLVPEEFAAPVPRVESQSRTLEA